MQKHYTAWNKTSAFSKKAYTTNVELYNQNIATFACSRLHCVEGKGWSRPKSTLIQIAESDKAVARGG